MYRRSLVVSMNDVFNSDSLTSLSRMKVVRFRFSVLPVKAGGAKFHSGHH